MKLKKYLFLKKNRYDYEKYSLIPIRIMDSRKIRNWRNDQIKFLRQNVPISNSKQNLYFQKVIKPTFDKSKPKLILFSYLHNSHLIGYGGFVNIDWKNKIAELSFLIETSRSKKVIYNHDFTIFLKLIKNIACSELKFHELYTETYDIRPSHIQTLEKNNFKLNTKIIGGKIIDEKPIDLLFHSYICDT